MSREVCRVACGVLVACLGNPSFGVDDEEIVFELEADSELVRGWADPDEWCGTDRTEFIPLSGTFVMILKQEENKVRGRIDSMKIVGVNQGVEYLIQGNGEYLERNDTPHALAEQGNPSALSLFLEIWDSETMHGVALSMMEGQNLSLFPTISAPACQDGMCGRRGDCFSIFLGCRPQAIDATRFFRRGDVNSDARRDIADSVALLVYLFQSGEPLGCPDAGDVDDDGKLELTDAVLLLVYLFRGAPSTAVPWNLCGVDTTADNLECGRQKSCMSE